MLPALSSPHTVNPVGLIIKFNRTLTLNNTEEETLGKPQLRLQSVTFSLQHGSRRGEHKKPRACDATLVDMGMLGGGGETLPSWRWMLPHVSLCVWCVP